MFAIIETLGHQYKVSVGDQIKVDRVAEDGENVKEGSKITFPNVLMVSSPEGKDVKVGTPKLEGASVVGKIIDQGKEKKGISYKKKRRQGYERKIGYRRTFTTVQIESIKAA